MLLGRPCAAAIVTVSLLAPALALMTGSAVAAPDRSGAARTLEPTVIDDRDLAARGSWAEVDSATAHDGTLSRSRDLGARLTTRTAAEAGGSVALQVGPRRGSVAIFVDGVRQRTVSTAAASKKIKEVSFTGAGPVRIKVVEPRRGVFVDFVSLTPEPTPAPGVGEVVITEVMTDPSAADDSVGEWFELRSTVSEARSLEDCLVQGTAGSVALPADALGGGTALVVARSTDSQLNGGVSADVSFAFPLTSEGELALSCGDTQVDTITWTTQTSGTARSLDADLTDASSNNLDQSWCAATTAYGAGDLGTPGAVNPSCPDAPPPLTPPGAGDLVLTEIMANPEAVSDTTGEWLELVDVSGVAHDLSGCVLSNQSGGTSNVHLPATGPGETYVLARSVDTQLNGGVLADGTLTIPLVNAGAITLMCGDAVVDSVSWGSAVAGASRSLNPSATTAVANDAESNWCTATTAYGDGDLGTPGDTNPACAG